MKSKRVIDKDKNAIKHLNEKLNLQAITAPESSPDVLIKAGIKDAAIFLIGLNFSIYRLASWQ